MSFCFQSALKKKDVEIKYNFDLSKISSIRCGGIAEIAIFPDSAEKLAFTLESLLENQVDFSVQGGLTNTLARDGMISKAVVITSKANAKFFHDGHAWLEAGASLSASIIGMAQLGFGSHEGLAHIPGTVGGALYGNAGAFGSEISEAFSTGEFYDLKNGKVCKLSKEEIGFSYRKSGIDDGSLVFLKGRFDFSPMPRDVIFKKISENAEIRRKTQPIREKTLGSVFKKHEGVGAGYYIDKAGLKGLRVGGAVVSDRHAGFIVNDSSATSRDVLKLVNLVKKRVFEKFGIILEEEIQILC